LFDQKGAAMAEKKAKTAESRGADTRKHQCPSCSADTKVVFYTGFGRKGFFWVCDKNCGYSARTR
jgi:hypothetical protein